MPNNNETNESTMVVMASYDDNDDVERTMGRESAHSNQDKVGKIDSDDDDDERQQQSAMNDDA